MTPQTSASVPAHAQGDAAFREYSPVIPRLVWGPGCAFAIGREMDRIGAERALLVCGKTVGASAWLAGLREGLQSRCVGIFAQAQAHTPIETLQACVAAVRSCAADCLIMVGGGSVQDTAKLTALILAEGDDLARCRVQWTSDRQLSIPSLREKKIPLIALPTTLSAAEVVGAATYVTGDKRYVVVDPALLPRAVMYDARLAAHTPLDLFLGTGINAIAHCIEAICSVRAQPFSDALALKALTILVKSLSDCAKNSQSLDAREQAQIGAAMSGIAYATTWLGIAHSLCQALGARFRTPQGALHAVMLPHAMRFNGPATQAHERDIVEAIGRGLTSPPGAGRSDSASLMADFIRSLGLPTNLRELGIPADMLRPVAEDSFLIWHTFFNPRKVGTADDLLQLLRAAW